jgi:hypothetical protein
MRNWAGTRRRRRRLNCCGAIPNFQWSDFGGIPDQPTLGQYLDGIRKAGLNECATQAELQKYLKMTRLPLCDAKRAAN